MRYSLPAIPIASLLVAIAALVPAVVLQSHAASKSSSMPTFDIGGRQAEAPGAIGISLPVESMAARPERRGALGPADGVVPNGTTVFDDELPGVANLDPALLDGLRRAAAEAADHGVVFLVESGWRSAAYQAQLLREAISEYGSEEEAARWVATPATSPHVSGDAVDIGPTSAAAWLSKHGAEFGLCQIYRNEPWHYELRPSAVDHGCPRMYADPTRDPRMQP